MKEKPSSFFTGRLKFKSLFEGSKSEGLYPVLNVDDDHSFRLHIRGNSFGDENPLLPLDGKLIQVHGIADNLRGHWRILLDREDPILVKEILAVDSNVSGDMPKESDANVKNSDDPL
jgi:hypothetical protein